MISRGTLPGSIVRYPFYEQRRYKSQCTPKYFSLLYYVSLLIAIGSLYLYEKILLFPRDQIGVFSIPVVSVGQLKCGSKLTKEIIGNSVVME